MKRRVADTPFDYLAIAILAAIIAIFAAAAPSHAGRPPAAGDSAACLGGTASLTPQKQTVTIRGKDRPLVVAFTEPDHDNDPIAVSVDSFIVNTPCSADYAFPIPAASDPVTDAGVAMTTVYVASAACQKAPMVYVFQVTCSDAEGSQTVPLTFTK